MEISEKKVVILTQEDLQNENIKTTVKTIEHNPLKFYLIKADWKTNLCYDVDTLSEASNDDTLLTKVRIAYDMNFNLPTFLKVGDSNHEDAVEVKSLAELLGHLDFNENLVLNREDYHVIVDDNNLKSTDGSDEASQLVAKLFQQIIFLNINLDIQKKSEIKKALIKDRFRAYYKDLYEQIIEQGQYLAVAKDHGNLNESGQKRVNQMLEAIKITSDEIAKAKKRPIRIAAMGTKKAGKSVVINALLKKDYAPTSSTLPTPNTIKYIPVAPDSKLTMEYADQKLTFESAENLSSFIGEEFKKAQKITGEGAGLPDMTIYYPCDDLNGYEVWDTPGPNVAFTEEHRKNAEECIKHVDVCIFVMNYSNHLTNDEVNFLNQIRDVFEKNKKFYSLFITVNRIDERYAVAEAKSVNRILDYISGRLDQLGYKNLVIFGTSALQSFYLEKVLELVKTDGNDEEPLIDFDAIRPLKKKHKEALTQISFIGQALGNLEDFHGIENATEKELEAFSGVPQLWHYVKYVGGQKADMEIIDSVISRCEMQFNIIKNGLNVTEYQDLSQEAKNYLEKVKPLVEKVNAKAIRFPKDMEQWIGDEALNVARNNANRESESSRRENLRYVREQIQLLISETSISSDEVQELEENGRADFVDFIKSEMEEIFNAISNKSAQDIKFLIESIAMERRDEVTIGIQELSREIKEQVEEVNNILEQSGVPIIELPNFPIEVSMPTPDTSKMSSSVNLRIIAMDSVEWVKRSGFFGFFSDFETWLRGKKKVINLSQFEENMTNALINSGDEAVNKVYDDLSKDVQRNMDEVFHVFRERSNAVGRDYNNIFNDTLEDINDALDETSERKEEYERNISVLTDIKNHIQPFFSMWSSILKSGDKN